MASSGIQQAMPVYRDSSKPVEERVSDLLSRMTLEEKAGQLFHTMLLPGDGGSLAPAELNFGIEDTKSLLSEKFISHFNLLGPIQDPQMIAKWQNNLQEYVLSHTRLGIPVTISSDPRNHFNENVGTAFSAGSLSLWPETLGFAALRNTDLVERFADIARQEYIAMGLRVSLHPQVDLATEYRWARISATFGEDADLSGELVQAYIRGFQGGKNISSTSVSTMTKHFPGGGPQLNGEDPHFCYGREQVYPGKNIEYHLKPFEKAIEAGTRHIMPYYGMPVGTDWEKVGFAFNKSVITGVLRERMQFQGIICTDWGLITDAVILGQNMPARAWGCEDLSELERALKILDAGCDQFGGETRTDLIVKLVEGGLLTEDRLDQSVCRILREKFELGLFENPYVDAGAAKAIVGQPAWKEEGKEAQRRAFTLLKNDNDILPLRRSMLSKKKIYVEGISHSFIKERLAGLDFELSTSLCEHVDIAILRLRCPFEPREGGFESHFRAGSLEFSPEEKIRQANIFSNVPISIVDVYLDRPAVIPEIVSQSTALTVSYGSSEDAFLDVIMGCNGAKPLGRLPFDLPRSMDAVRESKEDLPYDTELPIFKFGDGLEYR